jgi:hypothetical protein
MEPQEYMSRKNEQKKKNYLHPISKDKIKSEYLSNFTVRDE